MFKGYSSLIIVLLFLLPPQLEGQTPTDGLMMARRDLCTVVQFNPAIKFGREANSMNRSNSSWHIYIKE
jgi:hypothetical protein